MFSTGIKYYLDVILRSDVTSYCGCTPLSENGPSPRVSLRDGCVATIVCALWYKWETNLAKISWLLACS